MAYSDKKKAVIFRSPALASHEALEWGNAGVMAVVSELATGVAGLAKTLAVGRPNGYRAGQQDIICPLTDHL